MQLLIASSVLALAAQLPAATPPPRDLAGQGTGTTPRDTALIRGRVTDRESGQPLARVLVMLVPTALGDEQQLERSVGVRPEPRMTLTGSDGRFEYRQVRAGSYVVTFDAAELRGTHLRHTFGEAGREEDFRVRRPPPFQLKEGEVREGVDVALVRAFAIEGRVMDARGEPIANAEVSAHPWGAPAQVSFGRTRSTDDRGAFRLFGLKPGEYRICARPNLFVPSIEVRDLLILTCYPGAIADGSAQAVTVSSGDLTGIDITLQRDRAYKVTGVAIDSSGKPVEQANFNLVRLGDQNTHTDVRAYPGGQFVAQGVTPGDYVLTVEIGSRFSPEDKRERELGVLPVRVDDTDVAGLVASTATTTKVAGRLSFEGGAPEGLSGKIRVRAGSDMSASRGFMIGQSQTSAEVRKDSTFELTGLFGPQVVSVTGQPRGWILKAVTYRGEDVTDKEVEFKTSSDPRTLEIVLSRQAAVVSGRVMDERGKPTQEAMVLLVLVDPARRAASHIVSRTAPKADGTFALPPVRAGDYIIVAVNLESMAYVPLEGKILGRVAEMGERVALLENERRSIDLRVVKPH